MALARPRTDARAGSAADAGPGVGHGHDLALELVVIVIVVVLVGAGFYIDKLAIFRQTFQRHDVPAANLEATPASDTGLAIDRDQS